MRNSSTSCSEVQGQTSLERIVVTTPGHQHARFAGHELRGAPKPAEPGRRHVCAPAISANGASESGAQADDVATIVFTPGTTGDPKGVLSRTATCARRSCRRRGDRPRADDEIVSALPLGEITERALSEFKHFHAGATVNFGEGGASFDNDLREAQADRVRGCSAPLGEPQSHRRCGVRDAGFLKRRAVRATTRRGGGGDGTQLVRQHGPSFSLLRVIVCSSLASTPRLVASRVGPPELPRHRPSSSLVVVDRRTAAKRSMGSPRLLGPPTVTPTDEVRPGTAGRAVTGYGVRIGDGGEVQLRGDAVFDGYLDDEHVDVEPL